MAEEDDDLPRALRPKPTDLDVMSIGELSEYIGELEAEIERIRMAIIARKNKCLPRMPCSRNSAGSKINRIVNLSFATFL